MLWQRRFAFWRSLSFYRRHAESHCRRRRRRRHRINVRYLILSWSLFIFLLRGTWRKISTRACFRWLNVLWLSKASRALRRTSGSYCIMPVIDCVAFHATKETVKECLLFLAVWRCWCCWATRRSYLVWERIEIGGWRWSWPFSFHIIFVMLMDSFPWGEFEIQTRKNRISEGKGDKGAMKEQEWRIKRRIYCDSSRRRETVKISPYSHRLLGWFKRKGIRNWKGNENGNRLRTIREWNLAFPYFTSSSPSRCR